MPLPPPRRLAVLTPRRRLFGFLVAGAGLSVLTVSLRLLEDRVELSSALLLYVLLTAVVGAVGGIWPGIVAALVGSALGNYFFTPPFYTWSIANAQDFIALVVFVFVAVIVSTLVDLAARRAAQAERARAESASLVRLAVTVVESADPMPRLVEDLRTAFSLDAVAILRQGDTGWVVDAVSGSPTPRTPDDGADRIALTADSTLVLTGPTLPADDRRLLAAFAAQLAIAAANQQLQKRAAEAITLAETDRIRTALLSAVSHDLRTPLSSIKASASSLLASDVELQAGEVREFAQMIVEQTDRLNALIGNLLNLSRVRMGALQVLARPVELEEVVPGALAEVSRPDRPMPPVQVDVPETLPRAVADPALLERVVANLIDNALTWSPADRPVRVVGSAGDGRVELRVIDHGPGIPEGARERVLQPFQRLGDGHADGVGLGLAVASEFVQAMAGDLRIETTEGGGTTMILSLPAAP